MAKVILSKQVLDDLYNKQGKSMKQIGRIYGITRERVRQIMEQFGLKRTRFRPRESSPRYKSIEEYLSSENRKRDAPNILRRLLPVVACSECGSNKHLHAHHIKYPATSINDIQILCASCHHIKHKKGMTLIRQLELYDKYNFGVSHRNLMTEYNLTSGGVYQVIHKVKKGHRTYRG